MSRRPVDLARARAAEQRLAALLADKPHLRERTAAMLAGELECPDLEEQMPKRNPRSPVNILLPETLIDRADALLPLVTAASELATAVKVTRSDVLRLAILRGLEQLESEYAGQPSLPGT